jgi:ribonuclease HI
MCDCLLLILFKTNNTKPWGFFNGACQGTLGTCRVGAILYLDNANYLLPKYGAGLGTNNNVELYALWILLKVVVDIQVKRLQVFGDSKLLIDWENGKSIIYNLDLGPILDRIMEKKLIFEEVSFSHVYREFKHKDDQLSKEALILEEGCLLVHEIKDHTPTNLIHLRLF